MKDDDPKSKIINLFQETSAKDKNGQERAINVTISGDGNVVNFGSHSAINSAPSAPRPKVIVHPGETHISPKEAATLKSLVSKVHETEQKLKKRPSSYAKIWGQLNRHCKVTTYREISASDFEKARSYLNQWLGRLNSMRSAPVRNGDDWRKRHYAYIKINTKKPEDQAAFERYIKRKFKTTSLKELANDELEQAYRYVASRRQRQDRLT